MATSKPASASAPACDLYDALAPVYDRWQCADGMTPFALVVLAKLLSALERHVPGAAGPEPAGLSFVDLGCGTGELLLGLAREYPDWRLLGVDGSPAMLDVARQKPGGDRVTWQASPLAALALPAPAFDVAGCFYDTLNHLPDVAALAALFNSVGAALRPGGLFVFDATNDTGFDLWWRGNRIWRGPDWSVAIETSYDRARRLGHAEVTIDHDGRLTHTALTERCFSRAELRDALDGAGFELVLAEPWSPFDIDANGKTWWIGQKKPP